MNLGASSPPDPERAGGQDQCNPQDHDIYELKPEEYEEPYKSLHPFKCRKCGSTFSPHWLEQVDGKWQMANFAKHIKARKPRARR